MTTATNSRTTKGSKLDEIAANMRSHVVDAGAMYSHQRLQRGLEIVLQRHVEVDGKVRWRLALGRSDVAPSEDEIEICRKAFGVPVDTEHQVVPSKSRTNRKTRTTTTLYVTEMYWYEA
ncbi:MAG: hypothetical protein U0X20_31720 [Caldilineaceae bacterium]